MNEYPEHVVEGPVTAEKLMDIAVTAESNYKTCEPNHRLYHHGLMERALLAAEWMDANGVKEATYVGPFGPEIPFNKGDKVRVKAGSKVSSTGTKNNVEATARARVVKVWSTDRGWVYRDKHGIEIRHPKMEWVGTNGYWCWTPASNVEVA